MSPPFCQCSIFALLTPFSSSKCKRSSMVAPRNLFGLFWQWYWSILLSKNKHSQTKMPIFLFEGKCLAKGIDRLVRQGGTKRAAAIFKVMEAQGGKCKTVYFGAKNNCAETFAIANLPHEAAALAVQRTLSGTGTMNATFRPVAAPSRFLPESENLLTWDCFTPQTMPNQSANSTTTPNKPNMPLPPLFVRPFSRQHMGWWTFYGPPSCILCSYIIAAFILRHSHQSFGSPLCCFAITSAFIDH